MRQTVVRSFSASGKGYRRFGTSDHSEGPVSIDLCFVIPSYRKQLSSRVSTGSDRHQSDVKCKPYARRKDQIRDLPSELACVASSYTCGFNGRIHRSTCQDSERLTLLSAHLPALEQSQSLLPFLLIGRRAERARTNGRERPILEGHVPEQEGRCGNRKGRRSGVWVTGTASERSASRETRPSTLFLNMKRWWELSEVAPCMRYTGADREQG